MHIFPQTRREKSKVTYLLLIAAVWTAFGLFFGTQNYIRDTYAGRPASLPGYIIGWIFCGYSWGLLTIPVLSFIRRFSLLRLGWTRFVLMQLPSAVIFSLAQLAIYLFIAGVLVREARNGLWPFYKFLLANELQSSILVYISIVAAVTIYDRVFIGDPIPIKTPAPEASAQNGDGQAESNGHADGFLKRIPVKDNGRIVLVDAEQLERIESYGNYLFLYTAAGRFIHRETMSAMEKKLDSAEFVRIRRSAIVRIDRIRELRPIDNGEFEVVLGNGVVLSSTRRYKKNLESILKS